MPFHTLSGMFAAAAQSLQLCPTLCDPIDGSAPGSPVPGILQARTLEWVAISFSNAWKWKVKVKLLSHVWLLATPWTAAHQAPTSMGFSRQEYRSGVPLPSPFTIVLMAIAVLTFCGWVTILNSKLLVSIKLTEKAMAPHSSTLAWKIPWTEEPGRLQSTGWLRVRHDWATSLSFITFMHWRRKWQPTPVFRSEEHTSELQSP